MSDLVNESGRHQKFYKKYVDLREKSNLKKKLEL
jgi:hypothetical protein